MAYTASKPDVFISKAQSQIDIQQNFEAYKTAWDFDHYTFGDASQGKHKKVTMWPQSPRGSTPIVDTNDIGLFVRFPSTGSLRSEMGVKRGSNSDVYSFSRYSKIITSTYEKSLSIIMPSGLLLKTQSFENIPAETTSYSFVFKNETSARKFTAIYAVFVSIVNNAQADINVVAYVDSWTITPTAETVVIKFWRRNLDGTEGTDRGAFGVNISAIGKGTFI